MSLSSVTSSKYHADLASDQPFAPPLETAVGRDEGLSPQQSPAREQQANATSQSNDSGAACEHVIYDRSEMLKAKLWHQLADWQGDPRRAIAEERSQSTSAESGADLHAQQIAGETPEAQASQAAAEASETAREKSLLEMTNVELRALSADQKRQTLAAFGIPLKHLKKTKGDKLDRAFLDVVAALKTPGQKKLTLKLDKKYELKLQIDQQGQILGAQAKEKKGFWGKVGGVLKTVASVAGVVFAPMTGGLSLIASSALGAIDAIKNKNWLGAVASVAGAFVPGAGAVLGKTVATVANVVQKGAFAVQSAMMAVKAKSPGSLLGALAGGVSAVAGGLNQVSGRLVDAGQKLEHWANIAYRGESIVRAVKQKDFFGAASSALGAAATLAKDGSRMEKNLQHYTAVVERADTVQWALRSGNYGAAATGALGLAREVRTHHGGPELAANGDRFSRALRLVESGAYLEAAIRSRDALRMAQAGLMVGNTIDSIKQEYGQAGGVDNSKLGERLYKASRAIGWAESALRAARNRDYSSAATAALGLAAEFSENKKLGQAERIGSYAATLVQAIQSKDATMIGAAASALVEQVKVEREAARAVRQGLVEQASQAPDKDVMTHHALSRGVAPLPSRALNINATLPSVSQQSPTTMRATARINASVGRGGSNNASDVRVIQELLRRNQHHLAPLKLPEVTGVLDKETIYAIETFQQRVVGMQKPDGRVDVGGKTFAKLLEGAGATRLTASDRELLVRGDGRPAVVRPPQTSASEQRVQGPLISVVTGKPVRNPWELAAVQTDKLVSQMSATEKLGAAMLRAGDDLGPAAKAKLEALVSPTSLAIIAGTLGVWAGSHAIGVGFIADAALLGLGVATLGFEAIEVIKHFYEFASGAMNARTEADLERAGDHLAEAVTTVGIDAAAAFLTKGVIKGAKPPQVGTVRVVEMTNGTRVPVWVRGESKSVGANVMEARIVNGKYAGGRYPMGKLPPEVRAKYPEGVIFNAQGFPDFSPYAIKTVKIRMKGNRTTDFTEANKAAGLKGTPEGYTWHHHQDRMTMQLVPTDLHKAIGHSGGVSVIKEKGVLEW